MSFSALAVIRLMPAAPRASCDCPLPSWSSPLTTPPRAWTGVTGVLDDFVRCGFELAAARATFAVPAPALAATDCVSGKCAEQDGSAMRVTYVEHVLTSSEARR